MAKSSDNTVVTFALVGAVGFLAYQWWKQRCPSGTIFDCFCPGQNSLWGCLTNLHFGTGSGAPGLLPMGAGGTPGGQGGIPGGSTGSGAPTPATSGLPSPAGGGAGDVQCIDDMTGAVVPMVDDGTGTGTMTCPVGSTPWLAVNVSSTPM
jgi:hypothetical protein